MVGLTVNVAFSVPVTGDLSGESLVGDLGGLLVPPRCSKKQTTSVLPRGNLFFGTVWRNHSTPIFVCKLVWLTTALSPPSYSTTHSLYMHYIISSLFLGIVWRNQQPFRN